MAETVYVLGRSGEILDTTIDESYDNDPKTNTVWTDLRFPAERTKKITGKEPKETVYKGGQILEFEGDDSQAVAFNAQMDHGYKLGTDLEFHIHAVLPVSGSGAGVENVKLDFTYSWFEIGATVPSETTLSTTIDIQDLVADTHYLWTFGDILNANMEIGSLRVSSMLICSMARDDTVTDNTTKSFYLLEADFHYQKDQNGSRTETVK